MLFCTKSDLNFLNWLKNLTSYYSRKRFSYLTTKNIDMNRFSIKIIIILVLFQAIGCAKRGTITGGLKDSLAPKLINSFPKNYSTNFKGQDIKLIFDEYVKLKDASKQLVSSPPMQNPLDITPLVASKFLNIKITDTLQPNTTYSFNFGDCIRDNNEDNPLSQFKFVFSTGSEIDTLAVSGMIKDAIENKPDNFVSIMLYEINEKYNDSTIFKQRPRYVTNTLDSLKNWKIENVKAGKYALIALKDLNNNFKYDPKKEKIGFYQTFVTVPTKENYELKLFQVKPTFSTKKVYQASGNRAVLPFEGKATNTKITLQNGSQILKTIVTKFSEKDSLQIWYEKIKADSLTVNIENEKYKKKYNFKIKDQKKDTLNIISNSMGILPFRSDFELKSSTPIVDFDKSKIVLLSKDSVAIKFDIIEDQMNQTLKILFKKEGLEKYKLKIGENAITDFFGNTNKKKLLFEVETKSTTDYGNVSITLENIKKYPIIVELIDNAGKILATAYSEKNSKINFDLLETANKVFIRVIHDANSNKIWDSGNILLKQQPEEVLYFAKQIDVRANWDVIQPVNFD